MTLENKGITILRNVGNHSPNDIASHPRRREFIPAWSKPHVSLHTVRAETHYSHVTWARLMLRVQLGCERRFNVEFYDEDSRDVRIVCLRLKLQATSSRMISLGYEQTGTKCPSSPWFFNQRNGLRNNARWVIFCHIWPIHELSW